jgi:hypothetical protein
MQMPQIQTCDMTDCAYNKNKQCHAMAITVGDEQNPMCDTFWMKNQMSSKAGDPDQTGHVGACRMSECIFNDRLECVSEDITIGQRSEKPMCLTYDME